MGSIEADPDEFTVLVTGFAPFKQEYPQNPSWEIARGLPEHLPARTGRGDVKVPRVRVVVYPEPVPVNYEAVRSLVPQIWDAQEAVETKGVTKSADEGTSPFPPHFVPPRRIDLCLHIGMAGPRLYYALEKTGRRDGYAIPDVDGHFPPDRPADRDDPSWIWHDAPSALPTDVDLEAVLPRWRERYAADHDQISVLPDLRLSPDAGRYLCDWIYFTSLAHLFLRDQAADGKDPRYRRRRVAFLHVPASAAPERVALGRDLVVSLIEALVETEVARSGKDGEKEKSKALAEEPVTGPDPTGKWYRE